MTRLEALIEALEGRKRTDDNAINPVWNLALDEAIAIAQRILNAEPSEEGIQEKVDQPSHWMPKPPIPQKENP